MADATVFIAPQPYTSWILDANYDWQAPISMPDPVENGFWKWKEEIVNWELILVSEPPIN